MGVYSAVLGLFIPSGGGKWLLEAPYVMQAAIELQGASGLGGERLQRCRGVAEPHQPVLDAAAARRPRLKARDIVGFTFLQLLVHLPLVLFMLWALAFTLQYHPPVIP